MAAATLTSTASVFIRGLGMRAARRTTTTTTTTSHRPGGRGRKMRLRTTCEIRTRDAVQRAAAVLEMSEKDARDERKLKRAFRAAALKTHPDIAGNSSTTAFKVVQGAYRTLRAALLEDEGSGAAAAALDDDDVEWSEHDWRWKAKYGSAKNPEVMRQHTTEERAQRVAEQLGRLQMGEKKVKRGKRVIKPISQQQIPTEEEIAAMDSNAKCTVGKGQASRHSSNSAHDVLNSQLQGLHRKSRIKARVEAESRAEEDLEKVAVHYSTIKELEDSEEERFLRLARLAREWRAKQATWRETGGQDKMTPKELLQAAVQGASLGACA